MLTNPPPPSRPPGWGLARPCAVASVIAGLAAAPDAGEGERPSGSMGPKPGDWPPVPTRARCLQAAPGRRGSPFHAALAYVTSALPALGRTRHWKQRPPRSMVQDSRAALRRPARRKILAAGAVSAGCWRRRRLAASCGARRARPRKCPRWTPDNVRTLSPDAPVPAQSRRPAGRWLLSVHHGRGRALRGTTWTGDDAQPTEPSRMATEAESQMICLGSV
jgi:hypothetical protein